MATQTNIENNWENYFTRVNRSFKCNICNAVCSRRRGPVHLYRSHNITDQEVILQWNNDNHLIWQHFSKRDLFSAECKFCGKLIYSAYYKQNLDLHLRLIHSQEIATIQDEIIRAWVSPHFTFDYDCNANCKYCNYFAKIYDGVGVLKNHLSEDHDLDEFVVHRIGKELDYLVATMQCTIEESNVATSFRDSNTLS